MTETANRVGFDGAFPPRKARLALSVTAITCLLGLSAWMPQAQAVPISYEVTFHVTDVVPVPTTPLPGLVFDPLPSVGDSFVGVHLAVDSTALAVDAFDVTLPLLSFRAEIAGVVWDADPTVMSAFEGFRNSDGQFDSSPSFDVLGGDIVALSGGVFGSADFPFIDFASGFSPLPGTFLAADLGTSQVLGDFTIARAVPEPGTLSLWVLGLAGMTWMVLRANRYTGIPARNGDAPRRGRDRTSIARGPGQAFGWLTDAPTRHRPA